MTLTLESVRVPAPGRRTLSRIAAAVAAGILLTGVVFALVSGTAVPTDNTRGAGALSELLMGLAFLAGAGALALFTPVRGWRLVLWILAPFGLAVGGLTMIGVPAVGQEPPTWLFLLGVVPSFFGLLAVGIIGTRRVWPWWTGLALALFLPIMFLVPFNNIPMAVVWALVALTGGRRRNSSRDTLPDQGRAV